MGIAPLTPRQNKAELASFDLHTNFNEKELSNLYRQFKKETSQNIPQKEFSQLLKALYLPEEGILHSTLFNAFDQDKDGLISFKDFVGVLSVMQKGTPEEKLELAFRIYDTDGDGFLSHEDLQTLVNALFDLLGPVTTPSGKKYDVPSQLVDDFFEEMDTTGNGKISLEEYKEGAMKHPDIFQALRLFTTGTLPLTLKPH